jgi:transcription-repair coupling factor (superfamily II helicase)
MSRLRLRGEEGKGKIKKAGTQEKEKIENASSIHSSPAFRVPISSDDTRISRIRGASARHQWRTTMPDHAWLDKIIDSPALIAFTAQLAKEGHVLAEGAWGSSTTLVAGAIAARTQRPVLLVVAHLDDADDALGDLELFPAAGHAISAQRFGALEVLPGESSVSLELLAERLAVVERLAKPSPQSAIRGPLSPLLLVAPIQALMQAVPEPSTLGDFSLTLVSGKSMPPAALLDWLDRAGYRRVDAVELPGDFATRGGIIDVFAPSGVTDDPAVATGGPAAIRLDFFGDEIDSIGLIDLDTMGSSRKLQKFQLIGASIAKLQNDNETTHLVSLLPKETIVVLSEAMELAEQARGYYERLTDPRGIYSPQAVFKHLTTLPHIQIDQYGSTGKGKTSGKQGSLKLPVRSLASFDQEAVKAVKEIAEFGSQRVVVLCQKPAERERFTELLNEHVPQAIGRVELDLGYLHRGFVWGESETSDLKPLIANPQSPIVLIPHHELFHRYHTRRRIRRLSTATVQATDAFLDLNVGDFVVHVDHGIARFTGLRAMKRNDKTEDYLTLEFDAGALLHVPATQIELIQKYIGGFQGAPPLSTLGGKRWSKQKEQTRDAVKEMAGQMLRIQAARASLPGVRYPGDTAWQKEFEAEFPYDETEDQLAAIAAIKRDMSSDRPMDRLLCGDVGFGKTEVAIRAAFKAAEYGKQVAVLVPTTVLAEQHERTFRERMADYPFRVASLSRFKTEFQQNETLKQVARGEIDVVIGTHRLLSKDVKFADLGLVVIDEEQRFGVEHKNRLLQFRMTADVLTMTATPIPRTLHMSMLGLRDISSLTTPPVDRRAVVTEVVPYDEGRIKHAIVRELNRHGQVFFVHNRVHNIDAVANDVRRMVPDAKVIVGHGQMAPKELEDVMHKFFAREVDVLVSTTIIESGIDIATANTMFINNADHFGLAELHQLRGRVGRYKNRAYCYLMLPEERPITDKAVQRLKAIEQYSMLGAGFKIAMRDLEIRGAGNLLGAEQSGHIAAVGYQMYCHLLEVEAKKMRNEKIVEPVKTHVELPVVGRLTPGYIPSDKHRMDTYRRLSRASTLAELDAVVSDMTDAYGRPPTVVQTLIDLTEVRVAASHLDIDSMKVDGPDVIFKTKQPQTLDRIMKDAPGRVSLIDAETVYFRPPANYLEPGTLMAVLRKLLVRPVREDAS